MFESAVTATLAGAVVFLTVLIPRCVAQAPPGYSVPPGSLVTSSGTTYLPTSYTLTDPACTGTSASCPCAGGYLCETIDDCHWKCLMTTLPPVLSPTTAMPASNSASGTSITAVPTTSVPGGSHTSGGQGGTSQGGGVPSSAGPGGSSGNGGQQTNTAAPGQNTITVTQYASTCRRQTSTATAFTTDTVTSCPATCPSR